MLGTRKGQRMLAFGGQTAQDIAKKARRSWRNEKLPSGNRRETVRTLTSNSVVITGRADIFTQGSHESSGRKATMMTMPKLASAPPECRPGQPVLRCRMFHIQAGNFLTRQSARHGRDPDHCKSAHPTDSCPQNRLEVTMSSANREPKGNINAN